MNAREETDVEPIPETRYAQGVDGGHVAYQVVGSGPVSMLGFTVVPGIEMMWEEPRFVRFLDGLSAFSTHTWFDPRGLSSSSSLRSGEAHTVEGITEDMVTVLDAIGDERTAVLGLTSFPALLFAATHPSRVAALVLVNPTARFRSGEGYAGFDNGQVEQGLAALEREWGTGVLGRMFGWGGDERLQRWFRRCERLLCPPDEALRLHRSLFDVDLREMLTTISVPTLVVAQQQHPRLNQIKYVAEHIPGARYLEIPADDRLLAAFDAIEAIEEFLTGRLPAAALDRVLATVVFTDIVDSTAQAAAVGDRVWRHRLDEHDALVRRLLLLFRGREIKTLGDGFLATFDGPARAIQCGCAIRDEAQHLGIHLRVGMHTGEIELRGADIGGVTVSVAARVAALAGSAEVLVSRTVVDLVAGSGIGFDDRGEHELKGVQGLWRLFAVANT
jgi:class 3 adenylate cyclase/pimeloyl-ACP methyl ester carboxylesterase